MRISKLWSAVCAAAFLAGFRTASAQDNPAQAAARAALMEKINELNAQPGLPANQTMAPAVIVTPSGAVEAQPAPPPNKPMATAVPPPVVMRPAPMRTPLEIPPAPAGANDTPAQAAARAALTAKLSELNAQQIQTPSPVPGSGAASVPNAGQEQSGRPAKATTASPPPATPARALTHPAPRVTAAPKTNPPPASSARVRKVEPVAATVSSANNSDLFTPVPPPSNPGIQAGAAPAASGTPPVSYPPRLNRPPAATPLRTVVPPAKSAAPPMAPVVKPPPANANYPGKALGFPPVGAPPPPVTAQQQADLQSLLERYMANQISPEEYQKERAAILAKP